MFHNQLASQQERKFSPYCKEKLRRNPNNILTFYRAKTGFYHCFWHRWGCIFASVAICYADRAPAPPTALCFDCELKVAEK